MRRQMLSLFLTLIILISINGAVNGAVNIVSAASHMTPRQVLEATVKEAGGPHAGDMKTKVPPPADKQITTQSLPRLSIPPHDK